MAKDQLEPSTGIVTKGFLKFGWSFSFDLTDFGVQSVVNFQQAFVR